MENNKTPLFPLKRQKTGDVSDNYTLGVSLSMERIAQTVGHSNSSSSSSCSSSSLLLNQTTTTATPTTMHVPSYAISVPVNLMSRPLPPPPSSDSNGIQSHSNFPISQTMQARPPPMPMIAGGGGTIAVQQHSHKNGNNGRINNIVTPLPTHQTSTMATEMNTIIRAPPPMEVGSLKRDREAELQRAEAVKRQRIRQLVYNRDAVTRPNVVAPFAGIDDARARLLPYYYFYRTPRPSADDMLVWQEKMDRVAESTLYKMEEVQRRVSRLAASSLHPSSRNLPEIDLLLFQHLIGDLAERRQRRQQQE
jgi:Conserved region of unknown function on GLTSCR protein